MTPNPDRVLLRIPEVADALSVSRTVVYELIGTGEISTVHIGRAVRIPAASMHAYADKLVAEQSEGRHGALDGGRRSRA